MWLLQRHNVCRLNQVGLCLLGLAAAACVAAPTAMASDIPKAVMEKAFAEASPALCVVLYTNEVTNPDTGATTQGDSRVMGVIVAPDGLVIAQGHMQRDNNQPRNIRVRVGRGDSSREYSAVMLRKPSEVNLCFLRLQTEGQEALPSVRFTPDVTLALGDPLLLVGMLGENLDFAPALQTRRIGSVIESPRKTYCIDDTLPFGFVTAPVANAEGQFIGLIGYDLAAEEGGEIYTRSGHPLVYQAALFLPYIQQPPSETDIQGQKANAWLGVFTQPLTDDLAEYWNLPKRGGIVVSTIMPGSPAMEAGIQRGDVIVEFNGVPVNARQDDETMRFTKMVMDTAMGTPIPAKLLRNGQPLEVAVTLRERPKSAREADEFEDNTFGIMARELTEDIRIRLNLPGDTQGVIVTRVKSGSWAHLAGIRPGVIIMNFGGLPVASLQDFENAINKCVQEKPAEVTVFCRVGPRTGFFRLRPKWDATP